MTAKEYLEQLPDMRIRINAIRRKIAECKDRASDTAAKFSDQHNGGNCSKIEGNVTKAVDIETELKELLK